LNDLIKTHENENGELEVSGRELHEFLEVKDQFEGFYNVVCALKVGLQREDLRILRATVSRFKNKFNAESIIYLCDSITAEMILPCSNIKIKQKSESDYQKQVVSAFEFAFPQYRYLNKEVVVEGIGRIDILAEDEVTKRPVIIELKLGSFNPNKQLIAYGSKFEDPLLIGITENKLDDKMKIAGVLYFTYDELLRKKQ